MNCGGAGICPQCSSEAGGIYQQTMVFADARQRIIDRMLDQEIGV